MPNHTYAPGDLVERVSTGEQLKYAFCKKECSEIRVVFNGVIYAWPAADCRPAVDHDNAEELSECRSILHYIEKGHTVHCAKRMTYGDGECECGKVGNGHDTIAVATLKAEMADKDARIAELEAENAKLRDKLACSTCLFRPTPNEPCPYTSACCYSTGVGHAEGKNFWTSNTDYEELRAAAEGE